MIPSVWKYPDESITFKMDFSHALSDNETITNIVSVVCTSTPSDVTIEQSYSDAYNAYIQISGGTSGTKYTIKASLQTSLNSDTIDGLGYLIVY